MELLTREEIHRLSPLERLALIGELWDSLEEHQIPVSLEQRKELERRLETLDQDRVQGLSWGAVKADLEQRCP